MSGYVYLMELSGYHKIGQTIDVPGRLRTLDVGPVPLRLVHSFLSPSALSDEAFLHRRFASKWVRGEWFRLDREDVSEICRIESGPVFVRPVEQLPLALPPMPPRTPARLKCREADRHARRRQGQFVRQLAERAGLSIGEVSERTRIPRESLERIVTGVRAPGHNQRHALARVLGTTEKLLRLIGMSHWDGTDGDK